MIVAQNTVVSLRYCMKNSQGDVLENRLETAPVEYLHGSGEIMPALENGLVGLKAGDKTKVSIGNQMDVNLGGNFYFDVVIDSVRTATEGEIKNKKPAKPVKADDCGDDCICYT